MARATRAVEDALTMPGVEVVEGAAADLQMRVDSLDRGLMRPTRAPRFIRVRAARVVVQVWNERARELAARQGNEPTAENIEAFWDHVAASPVGRAAMYQYVERVDAARKRGAEAVVARADSETTAVLSCRASVNRRLTASRSQAIDDARRRLARPASVMKRCLSEHKAELRRAGHTVT